MSNESPLNVREDSPDSPSDTLSISRLPDHQSSPSASPLNIASTSLADGFPPLPSQRINESGCDDGKKKGKVRKRKGKKRKAGRSGKAVAAKPQAVLHIPDQAIASHSITTQPHAANTPTGEEGVGRVGPDRIGLHWLADKNMDQKETIVENQPIEGVEDVLQDNSLEEVQTRAEVYSKIKGAWEAAGDICVRIYARPLNPRLILVEWEGDDGVEKHGRIVVNERQRGMFGPGKVVWVKGPLVGDRWLLAGKYNFLGNRVS